MILERGPRLPIEPQNADAEAVFVQRRYRARDEWQKETGKRFMPGQFYFVGGHTKFFGTAMFRFRERDFEATELADGVSPAWPFSYSELEPWYGLAERLFGVHGRAGDDPTEPWRSSDYPHPPIPHEPVIGKLADKLAGMGLHPFHMPSAVDLHPGGRCVRCGTCDAFACRYGAKGDSETRLLSPALAHPNVNLWTETRALRLITDDRGHQIVGVEVSRHGETFRIRAPQFVLSAGAIQSALLLQRSADGHHTEGLANTHRTGSPVWHRDTITPVWHGPHGTRSGACGAGPLVPLLRPPEPACSRCEFLPVICGVEPRTHRCCAGPASRRPARHRMDQRLTTWWRPFSY